MGRTKLDELVVRVTNLEAENSLLFRFNPSISFGTQLHDLGNVPACSLYNSAVQDIGNASWTTLIYDTVRFDVGQMADTSNNRINIVEGGIYLVIAQINWEAHATDGTTRGVYIETDNNTIVAETEFGNLSTNTHAAALTCSTLWKMDGQTTGELFFKVKAYQNSGGNLEVNASTGTDQRGNNLMVAKIANFGGL